MSTTVNPVSSTTSSPSSTTATVDKTLSGLSDQFMNLLVTQIKNQDPLSPMDTSTMTTQLAQLSSAASVNGIAKQLDSVVTELKSINDQLLAFKGGSGTKNTASV